MNSKVLIAAASIALAAATILAACGGGSSGGMSSSSSMAHASGTITGFGSVFVNGREFATDMNTQVLDGDNDDAASSTSSLTVGMTVDVDASSGTATMLRFTSAVRGEVDSVDMMHGTLTVLGQTVQTTGGTSFVGNVGNSSSGAVVAKFGDIHQGDYVVVYGYLECPTSCSSGATTIMATLINEPSSVGMYRVQGYVNNYSSGSFMINGLTVDIATTGASPTVCNTMNCSFANGDFVSVRSTTPASGSPLTLTASSVKLRHEVPTFAMGSTVTLEGPVTQLSGATFVVRGITVDTSGIMSGVTGLANNQIVEVTGTISSNGTLMATSVEVERSATFALMGAIDMGALSTTGFSVLGQMFSVTSNTRFGDRAMDTRPFDSTNFSTVLMAGDQLVVSGYPSGSGNVATRVERIPKPGSPQAAVEGVVSSDNAPTDTMMTIGGITVTLTASTKLFYAGAGMTPSLTGFFAAITPNTTVAAAFGTPGTTSGTITAADAAALTPDSHWED